MTVKNHIFALMKTTKNERLGLVALTLILAAIVAMAIFHKRIPDAAPVPVEVIESSASTSTAVSDTIKEKKKTPRPRKGKKDAAPKPDMRRDPFEHSVTPN